MPQRSQAEIELDRTLIKMTGPWRTLEEAREYLKIVNKLAPGRAWQISQKGNDFYVRATTIRKVDADVRAKSHDPLAWPPDVRYVEDSKAKEEDERIRAALDDALAYTQDVTEPGRYKDEPDPWHYEPVFPKHPVIIKNNRYYYGTYNKGGITSPAPPPPAPRQVPDPVIGAKRVESPKTDLELAVEQNMNLMSDLGSGSIVHEAHVCKLPGDKVSKSATPGSIWKCDCGKKYVRNDMRFKEYYPAEEFWDSTLDLKNKIGAMVPALVALGSGIVVVLLLLLILL